MRLTILFILAISLCIGVSAIFAAKDYSITGTTTFNDTKGNPTTLTFTPSTNVQVDAKTDIAVYAATAKHKTGDRQFGVASNSTGFFWNSATAGDVNSAPSASDSAAFSGWNSI